MGRLIALLLFVLPSPAWAYGEVVDGLPSPTERDLLLFTNQVRQDPLAWPGWDSEGESEEAVRPLYFDADLARASRAHAEDMLANQFFSHNSSDGRLFGERVSGFFAGAAAENLFRGVPGRSSEPITLWMGSPDDRANLLRPQWTHLGLGGAGVEDGLRYFVQTFGTKTTVPDHAIPVAAFDTSELDVARLGANYYDPSGNAAVQVRAAVGSGCIDLERVSGSDGNSSYGARLDKPAGCEPLVFDALRADGQRFSYPETGSLLIGEACPADFDAEVRPQGCSLLGESVERPEISVTRGCACVLPAGGFGVGSFLLLLGPLLRPWLRRVSRRRG